MNFLSLVTSLLAVNSAMVFIAVSFAAFIFLFLLIAAGSNVVSRRDMFG